MMGVHKETHDECQRDKRAHRIESVVTCKASRVPPDGLFIFFWADSRIGE